MKQITIRSFGRIKELIGTGTINLKIEDDQTLINILDSLIAQYKNLENIIPDIKNPRSNIRFLLNGQSIEISSILKVKVKDGDILAILPPVSGG